MKELEDVALEPHDDDVEKAFIGALLLSPASAVQEYLAIATPEAIYRDAHREIVTAIEAVAKAGDAPDITLVLAELKRRKWNETGGMPYLRLCIDYQSTPKAGPKYAKIIAGYHARRKLIEVAAEAAQLARDNGKPPAELMASVQAMLKSIPMPETKAPLIFGDSLCNIIGEPEWLWQNWLPKGFLTVLAADPGLGKSSLALWIAAQLGCAGRWPDGSPMNIGAKTLYLDAEAMQGENLKRLRVWGFDRGCVAWAGEDGMEAIDLRKPGTLRAYCEAAKAAGCGLVIVDSLSQSAGGDERAEILEPILTEGALAARDLGIALLVIHHLRKARQDEPSKVALDRLRGSSVIGQVARCVWGMWRPDRMDLTVRVEVIKSNLGPTGEAFGLQWSENELKFVDPPEGPASPETAVDRAEVFLKNLLRHGPMPWNEVKTATDGENLSFTGSVDRAATRMGVIRFTPDGQKGKFWALPR